MAPIPSDKSDSASESTIDLAAGYLGVIILAICALLLLMLVCAIVIRHHILNIIGCWIKNCYIRAKTALGTTRLKAKSLLSTITLKKTRTQSYDPKNTSDVRLQYLVPPPKAAHTTTTTIDDSPCSL
ncbi:hypothetical protein PROQFM164_S01g002637 [Penicillium roqueforti FM164]|uniref:Uncharacterized protein n=1 Tax=Penicillium roqueforti (strain FM164) TaxID=1365484 RepID=W6PYM1_PENRF|nr:hypothetical protein PROQFM164_S01g002637 [Penicillium roqueforti FM164]